MFNSYLYAVVRLNYWHVLQLVTFTFHHLPVFPRLRVLCLSPFLISILGCSYVTRKDRNEVVEGDACRWGLEGTGANPVQRQ